MPIRGFNYYGQPEKKPITMLNNSVIAIDGFWFLKKYLAVNTEEHFNDYTLAIKECLEPIIKLKETVSIMWIWDGLEYRETDHSKMDKIIRTLESSIAKGYFSKSLFDQELYVNFTTNYLKENNITVVRAPYSAIAQCVYFLKESCVQYIFSKTDALLFESCVHLITEFEFKNEQIQFIDRGILFEKFNLNLESFRRTSFVSGCEFCVTHPLFAEVINFDLISIINYIKANEHISFIDGLPHPGLIYRKFKEEYKNAFCIVDYHPVMHLEGIVKPISEHPAPRELETIFGKQQSNFIYSQIFSCVLGVKVLNVLIFRPTTVQYQKKILKAFEGILNSQEQVKPEEVFDLLAKKLDLTVSWEKNLSKVFQLLFVLLSESECDINTLLRLLKVASATKSSFAKDEQQSKEESKYKQELFKFYVNFNEALLFMKDLINLTLDNGSEGIFDFEVNFIKLNNNTVNASCKQFLTKNLKDKHKKILDLLE